MPFSKSEKKYPAKEVFKSDNIQSIKLTKSTSTTVGFTKAVTNEAITEERRAFSRSLSVQENQKNEMNGISSHLKIILPTLDDEDTFKNFFPKSIQLPTDEQDGGINLTDFDDIKVETKKLAIKKVTQGPKHHRRPGRNPLKTLAERKDIRNDYTEIIRTEENKLSRDENDMNCN